MTNNTHNPSAPPEPASRGEVVAGRQALIEQAMRCRAQLLGKLNQGAR